MSGEARRLVCARCGETLGYEVPPGVKLRAVADCSTRAVEVRCTGLAAAAGGPMGVRELIAEDVAGRRLVRTWRQGDDYGTTIYYGTTAVAGHPYDSLAEARLGHVARVEEFAGRGNYPQQYQPRARDDHAGGTS